MELVDLISLRPVPCAGVLLMLTQRCPLHCAHCSTASTMAGPQTDAAALRRLVDSFGPENRPELVMFTGGEPLLRPGLVTELARAAAARGVRTALLSGMFFARHERVAPHIQEAIRSVDHFSASLDREHEREVPRAEVLRTLATLLDDGMAVSLHLTGHGADDPYLAEVTAQVRREFGDRVPMLVNEVRAVGRATSWATAARIVTGPDEASESTPDRTRVLPCAMAAWPVVAADGTVLACCGQDAVDRRPAPEHLLLGNIADDDWPTLRERAMNSPELRMVRALGPLHLRSRFGDGDAGPDDYCAACLALPQSTDLPAIRAFGAGPAGELLDRHATRTQAEAGPVALMRRFGCAKYAELVAPGGFSSGVSSGAPGGAPGGPR
ncbi:radical SAM protein [Catenulispora sp. NF23]|uniref:radical SAM protein n=1 Tax=Catenulispora pinistramenti TaxID=2705254 RepID=UPI001BAC62D1|nr:radical SAM protein [Catenulispora pinistramenti]MBS2538972.1 radical SAM protein [Catenulispora pinistramenti]